ncbi:MAG TPA: chemotaxis protein CheW [Blastocatellia bacterium]|nr:chemotaxis protein CheW [Blastocatellia bacterium]
MARGEEKPRETSPFKVGPLPLELISTANPSGANDQVSVLLFTTGDNQFSIGVEHTEGVVDCPRISPLPSPPDGIIGVTSVRGRMTLVMDLSLASNQPEAKRSLILVKGDAQLGLIADHVEGVVALEPKQLRAMGGKADQLSKQHESEAAWPAKFYFKHEGRRVPIVDIERLSE